MFKRLLKIILSLNLIVISFIFFVFAEKQIITIDDILKVDRVSDLQISPDCKYVVWVQSKPDFKKDKRINHLWMAFLKEKIEPIQLTRGENSNWSPRWSPDGKRLAFLSDRKKKSQIFIMPILGGEPEQVTDVKMGIIRFAWRNNHSIIFSARENEYFYEKKAKERKDDAKVIDDIEAFYPIRLFEINLKDKKIIRITKNKDRIQNFAISPNGNWAITMHIDTPLYEVEAKHRPKYFLINLNDYTVKEIWKEKYFSPTRFQWSYDSRKVFLIEEKSNYEEKRAPGIPFLYEYNLEKNKCQLIPINWEKGIGEIYGRIFDAEKNKIVTSLANGVINPLIVLERSQKSDKWRIFKINHKMAANISNHDLGKDGKTFVFIHSTSSTLPALYCGELSKNKLINVRKLVQFNKHLKNKFIAKSEIIRWKSKNGREIEGILYYPKDYEKGKRYPLIVSIHGGPSAYDPDWFTLSWGDYPHLLAGKNCFVLFVNYSGSSNYGLEFLESIFGKYYELEIPDILSGIDYLIDKGLVDPDKLGLMGWSNGAILSIGLVVETDRFKVACCGAGDVNWISDYGNCRFGPQFDNLYLGGPFREKLDVYIKKSPIFRLDRVKTPTLILFGDKDTNVPTEQGFEHYRTLQQIGKVPVRFVLFPGEPHGFRRISHQRRKIEEELAWFDKYLFGKEEKKNKALKKGSPLDIALKKDFKYDEEGNLGIIINGILVPETVRIGKIEVGRFEVTRAQFAQFLRENKDINTSSIVGWTEKGFKPGTQNYPVSGIDFEIAIKYCKWLSEKTGEKYRLPKEKEMKEWLEKCTGNENTLCYWAGYNLSPDEADMLEEKFQELEKTQGLILPVGYFNASFGKIYDLNGNVSEWCVKENGEGIILGLSARHICDKKEPYRSPSLEYVGFRILKETK
ncbi:prolyl oligopeptidase family serine peptidase [Candidatus Aminicenantes bacterium AC-335-A11]|jgi:dipeptidyl aminopeptidase/acylaminoacyl peptidase|nr:prolyl oligopeptidase family serine peptidase [SCandidatus Aminicenantes bacterium Aminicenantia_JdfR_composite]MCP2596295.1 prolyl oligopeptidase family serine peptidase [Candidatus Aminicenantes bacterium AC-335-G13]MCP2597870.1 prolyl oligopeptidase family serine peptidase [Candidatus Aminicenantes bacterium AC-335-L06]MCP2606536.1 prolyl oligopeptidase family serine peptidase [Candidatus Aminicenantes bacterium AC-708-I09]MCP2618130.1 prolyl oligopeptidase family serine peptidase [Candid